MLSKSPRACFSLLCLFLLAPSVEAQFKDHHPPYVDPHFDLHHTPKYDYGARPTYSDYMAHAAASDSYGSTTCGVCNGDGNCNGDTNGVRGSRSPKCPPIDNAGLQLFVDDGLEVEINGQEPTCFICQ